VREDAMALHEHGRVHHFPVEDLTYDVLTILHEKSRALEAYEKYLEDARGDAEVAGLLRDIRDEDELHIERLQQHLARLLAHDVSGDGHAEELPRSAETASAASADGELVRPPGSPHVDPPFEDDDDGDGE
jgi:hypothetical protein